MIDDQALASLAEDAFNRDMLTAMDPKDMSYILPELDGTRIGIEAFVFYSAVFRMYSKRCYRPRTKL